MRNLFLAALAALLLTACSGVTVVDPETGVAHRVEGRPTEFIGNLATATRQDAVNAAALAAEAGNEDWKRCWDTVIVVIDERKLTTPEQKPAVVGPLSALQKASNIYRAIDDGLDGRVRANCAIVVLDVVRFAREEVLGRLPGL